MNYLVVPQYADFFNRIDPLRPLKHPSFDVCFWGTGVAHS
jgi:hypothetical protein